jgi:hypothetical protein
MQVAVHDDLPGSGQDLDLLYEWEREYRDSDITIQGSRERHGKKVSAGRVVYFRTMREERLIGYCEFHHTGGDLIMDWFFALRRGRAAMESLMFYFRRRFPDPSQMVCLNVSLDPGEPSKAAEARLRLYSEMGFLFDGVTREASPPRWLIHMRTGLGRPAMEIVKHGPTMRHRVESEDDVGCYGTDVPSYFHHVHHETSPPTVEHCGGPHVRIDPRLDYTLEHCACGKHVSDRKCVIGHDEEMREILWYLTEACPSDPSSWHLESGLSFGRFLPGTCVNCGLKARMFCSACRKFCYCARRCATEHRQEHQKCHPTDLDLGRWLALILVSTEGPSCPSSARTVLLSKRILE